MNSPSSNGEMIKTNRGRICIECIRKAAKRFRNLHNFNVIFLFEDGSEFIKTQKEYDPPCTHCGVSLPQLPTYIHKWCRRCITAEIVQDRNANNNDQQLIVACYDCHDKLKRRAKCRICGKKKELMNFNNLLVHSKCLSDRAMSIGIERLSDYSNQKDYRVEFKTLWDGLTATKLLMNLSVGTKDCNECRYMLLMEVSMRRFRVRYDIIVHKCMCFDCSIPKKE